jgi:cob(I)alamin adenosyltransferase
MHEVRDKEGLVGQATKANLRRGAAKAGFTMIHVYTGEGKGKTTAAFGLALRALGTGRKVVVVQFLKGRKDVGEYKLGNKLQGMEVHQFGRPDFVDPLKPLPIDFELAQEGLKFARKCMEANPPDLLILDEINVALKFGLLKLGDVLALMRKAPKSMELVLTGRYAPKEVVEKADLVTEMKEVSHPFQEGVPAREGVEF